MFAKKLFAIDLLGLTIVVGALLVQPALATINGRTGSEQGGFRTPQMSNYKTVVESNKGFHTPRTSNYVLNTVAQNIGFHTPQSSNYVPVVSAPGWRTPPTSNYVR